MKYALGICICLILVSMTEAQQPRPIKLDLDLVNSFRTLKMDHRYFGKTTTIKEHLFSECNDGDHFVLKHGELVRVPFHENK